MLSVSYNSHTPSTGTNRSEICLEKFIDFFVFSFSNVSRVSTKEYPMDSLPPTNLHAKVDADVKPTAVTKCRFSGKTSTNLTFLLLTCYLPHHPWSSSSSCCSSSAFCIRSDLILILFYSGDGQYLACALANRSGQIFKMPLGGKTSALLGKHMILLLLCLL